MQVQLIVYLTLIFGHLVAGQQQSSPNWPSTSPDQLDSTSSERVERLASAAGDRLWRPSPDQLEWILQTQYKKPLAALGGGYYFQAPQQAGATGLDGLLSNYHALVDEFKQYSRLANPSRESRAFKPKLMSTARGFGKRAHSSDQRITYSDLLAAANPNGAILTNGKMSGEGSR